MAIRTFLGSGDTFNAANNGIQVFGASGAGTEKLLINSGVTGVITDANIERIDVAGNLADYKFVVVAGTGIQVQNTAGTVIGTIPSLNQATTLAFANGSASLVQSGGTAFTLGGQAISTTTATPSTFTTTALGTNFNTTVTSGVTTTTTPTTPTIGFSAATASVTEGDTNSTVTLTVGLSQSQLTNTTVNYTTVGGSALAGSDFTATTGSVQINAGSTSATFTIPIVGDTSFENSETFTVVLSNPSTGASLGTTTATVTIADNDTNAAPTNTITGTLSGVTGGTATALKGITVADANDATGTVTFTAANGILTFDADSSLPATGTTFSYDPASRSGSTVKVTGNLTSITNAIASGELTYVTNLTAAGSDSLSVSVTDPHAISSTAATGVINVGMPLTLTTGTNNTLTGGTGSDTITGDATTVEAGDSVNGGNGTDLLYFKNAANSAVLLNATVTDVENVLVQTVAGGAITPTLDASKLSATGVNINFNPTTNTDAFTVTGLSTNYTVQVDNSALTTPGTGTIGLTGAAAIQVAMDGGDKISTLTTTTATGLTVTSTGGTNTISSLQAGAASTLVTVKGTGSLTVSALGGGTPGNVTKIAADSTYSGSLNFTGSANTTTAMTITGALGNDTLVGGTGADTITGGKGVDSMTGGTGADIFMFTQGDTSSTSRDVITDLALGDIINLSGYTGISLTSGGTLATNAGAKAANSTLDVYIDSTNSRLVIETADTGSTVTTEEITIGDAAKASFSIGASNTLTVGNQPLTSTNNGAGTLTMEGAAVGAAAAVVIATAPTPPTVNGATIGSNAVSIIDASKVVPGGSGNTTDGINQTIGTAFAGNMTITGSAYADILTGSSGVDTITGGLGVDTITGGLGADSITGGTGADVISYSVVGQGGNTTSAAATALTAGDTISGFVTTVDDIRILADAGSTNAGVSGAAGAWNLDNNAVYIVTGSTLDFVSGTTLYSAVSTAIGNITASAAGDTAYIAFRNAAGTQYNLFEVVTGAARAGAAVTATSDTISHIAVIGTTDVLVAGDFIYV